MMQYYEEIKHKLARYIAENYIDTTSKRSGIPAFLPRSSMIRPLYEREEKYCGKNIEEEEIKESVSCPPCAPIVQAKPFNEIDDFLKESFEEGGIAKRLNLYMYERDITTAMIYERCYVDRRLISKITSGTNYHPSKNTMLALCIGLRLSLQEGEEFLLLAGYSFSNTSKYDLIMKFMLQNRIYDLDIINEMLYQYEQPCLGT